MAFGEKILLTPEESKKWKNEEFYTDHKRICGYTGTEEDGLTLMLEPDYRQFCFQAEDHISNVEIIKDDEGDEIISFDVCSSDMITHISEGDKWESAAF